MTRFILTLSIILLSLKGFSQHKAYAIIPQPNESRLEQGYFQFEDKLSVAYNSDQLKASAEYFKAVLKSYSEKKIQVKTGGSYPGIYLELDDEVNNHDETYQIRISSKEIKVQASSPHGIFNGLQSVLQLLLFSPQDNDLSKIHKGTIKDEPRYAWRGLMLDESRHFFGKEKVKQLLDYMALHKLNRFHWHLTDSPGWRIEIKQYPKLGKVGGIGNHSDSEAKAQYYSQKEIAEIVAYAKERYIEVIPEIDMPGHASAANRAYPEFSGGGSEKYPDFTFNPGKEEVYQYLTNILQEVKDLFPAKYIHLGGDEVHFGNHQWKDDKAIQALMKNKQLDNLKAVEEYFIRRMADSLKTMNRQVIGWDEVVEAGLDPENSLVMWWRHDKPQLLTSAVQKGYKVVMCPRLPMYFDFIQDERQHYGRTWDGFCDVESVYHFPKGIKEADSNLVAGIQACVWTENIQNNQRLDYMLFPRLSAMAEAAWCNQNKKSYTSFKERLPLMVKMYQKDEIYYYDVFNPENHQEPKGLVKR
ncbi:MAG: beta-N-acetylhexosaminidase [Carboxylicivirga sp.]|jgi:hexosaminidase|nr:beta-N-acetylhexosaminidase [Carboxylicivirga sp.]